MAGEMHTYIAGAPHHPGARKRIERLRAGEALSLRREPDNPHDRNAVAVHDGAGLKLGYIPRVDAPTVARAIGTHLVVTARSKFSTYIVVEWKEGPNVPTL